MRLWLIVHFRSVGLQIPFITVAQWHLHVLQRALQRNKQPLQFPCAPLRMGKVYTRQHSQTYWQQRRVNGFVVDRNLCLL